MAKLCDVLKIEASSTPVSGDQYWLLNLDMVEQQTGRVIDYHNVSEDALGGSIIQFNTENVLYSKLRPNLNKVVVPEQDGFATSEMLPLKPAPDMLDKHYLAVFLRSDNFVTWAVSKTAGAKMPRLGTKELLGKEIPLPSLTEQRRIAQQFSKVDELIVLRKEQLAKLDQLVKSRFVEMFGGIHDSKLYPYKAVKEITDVISGGTPSRDIADYWQDGTIPWVKTTELQNSVITGVEEYITEEGLNNSSAKLVPMGTVLIAMYGQGRTRGMTGYLGIEACTNQACACILPSAQINQKFLWQYFVLSYDNLRDMAKGGNQPNLNGNIIKNYPVLYPPREKQEQFAAFVEQTDKSKLTIQASLDKLELLKKSLMQQYFG